MLFRSGVSRASRSRRHPNNALLHTMENYKSASICQFVERGSRVLCGEPVAHFRVVTGDEVLCQDHYIEEDELLTHGRVLDPDDHCDHSTWVICTACFKQSEMDLRAQRA